MINKLLLLILLAITLPAITLADNMSLPTNGITLDLVASQYGEPEEKLPAVGEPPITRWNYSDYTVYFEHNLVLHTVKNR